MKFKPTTYLIAREAGVSQSAVSHILNNTATYSEETRYKVLSAAKKLGYQNAIIRKAIKKSLKQLGFVLPDIGAMSYPVMSDIFAGVSKGAISNGYVISTCEISNDIEKNDEQSKWFQRIVDLSSSGILDGLVIDKSHFAEEYLVRLESLGVPFVFINGRLPKENNPVDMSAYWCSINHADGVFEAAELLINLGHSKIAIFDFLEPGVMQKPYFYESAEFYFLEAMRKNGIEIKRNMIMRGELGNPNLIFSGIDILLGQKEPPTAIFIPDDNMAIAAINHLRVRGYRVPENISVVGYGGSVSCESIMPDLTTVKSPWLEMGRIGVKMLIDICEGKSDTPKLKILPAVIRYGKTAGPVMWQV